MSKEYSFARILFIAVAVCVSIYTGIYYGYLLVGNELALQIIVTVFSILAGFLVAVMTIISEPMASIGRSWRFYEVKRDAVRKRLNRQKILFLLYITTLIMIFIHTLLGGKVDVSYFHIENIIMFLTTLCFIVSLNLPWALMNTQLSRFDEIILEKQRNREKSGPKTN